MKKWIFIMLALLLCVVLAACDSGLAYEKMELLELPARTVYKVGKDDALEFDGGVIRLTTRDGRTETRTLREYTYQHGASYCQPEGAFISSDVDFDVPGKYTVTVWQTKDVYCQYTVTVEQE